MPKVARKSTTTIRSTAGASKYDAHHSVLDKTYGAFADLRRGLSDSKEDVSARTDLLLSLSTAEDSQRAWLYLEDYFEKLFLSRKDFHTEDWWERVMKVRGVERLEEVALLFLRANRSLPTELLAYANFKRFAELKEEEKDQNLIHQLEDWMLPAIQTHLDAPRARLRVLCTIHPSEEKSWLNNLHVKFGLMRPKTGERIRSLMDITELTQRSAHERELFSPEDWTFIEWLAETYPDAEGQEKDFELSGIELLRWLARWGTTDRLKLEESGKPIHFDGQTGEFSPNLEKTDGNLYFTQRFIVSGKQPQQIRDVKFFVGPPTLALLEQDFTLIGNTPPSTLLNALNEKPALEVRKLSHRLLTHLRRRFSKSGKEWNNLCITHTAKPLFTFELSDDTIRLRLKVVSDQDKSSWQWNGHEWVFAGAGDRQTSKPEIFDDERLDHATEWLRGLDWFTPEPGLWIGDANENGRSDPRKPII